MRARIALFVLPFAATLAAQNRSTVTFGGSGADVVRSIATDGSFYYFFGETTSPNLPRALNQIAGGTDLFIAKYDPRTRAILWTSYIGGTGNEAAATIRVDSQGYALISGSTPSQNFPTSSDALQRTYGGGASDLFVMRVSPRGTPVWSSYFGGTGAETGGRLGLDRTGNIYLAGATTGALTTTPGAAQTAFGGVTDVFVVKLNPAASQVLYLTYVGGAGLDNFTALHVDADGNAYVSGSTSSQNFPVSAAALQAAFGGVQDGFLTKINAAGSQRIYSTYIGGAGSDRVAGMFVSERVGATRDNVWLSMTVASTTLPTSPNAYLNVYSGGISDGYVVQLAASGSTRVAATYLGGPDEDRLTGMFVGPNGAPTFLVNSSSDIYGPAASAQGKAIARSASASRPANINQTDVQIMQPDLSDLLNHVEPEACLGTNPRYTEIIDISGTTVQREYVVCGFAELAVTAVCSAQVIATHAPGGNTGTINLPNTGTSAPVVADPAPGQSGTTGSTGDPVSTATGELYDSFVDIALGGPAGLAFSRYYGSKLGAQGFHGALGNNWMHNFEAFAESGVNEMTIRLFGGKRLLFRRANAAAPWQLQGSVSGGYQLVLGDDDTRLLSYAGNIVHIFNAAGKLMRIEDRNGNAATITQGPYGPTLVADGMGRTLAFTYSLGRLTKVTDHAGRSVSFAYTGDDLTSITNLGGGRVTYSYTAAGTLAGLIARYSNPAGGETMRNTYDAAGRVTQQLDGGGNAMTLAYQAGATTITYPLAVTERHAHNASALTSQNDPAANVNMTYDAAQRRDTITDSTGAKTSAAYHAPTGYLASMTTPTGSVTAYTYTEQIQSRLAYYPLTKITYADGATQSYSVDARGNVTEQTDRNGNKTAFTYNARGQVTEAVNANGGKAAFTYNADATLASLTDARGVTTTYTYGAVKRLTKMTFADGSFRTFEYNANDHIVKAADELGNTWESAYDANLRMTARTTPLGDAARFTYSADSQILTSTDFTGARTEYAYDAAGRMTSMTTPTGRKLTFIYDAVGRMTSYSDEGGKINEATYGADGMIQSVKDGLDRVTRYEYDAGNHLTKEIAPSGAFGAMTYNEQGQLTSHTDGLGGVSTLKYDARGQIVEAQFPGEIVTKLNRSKTGAITSVLDPNGSEWKAEYNSADQLVKITDPLTRETALEYDNRGRVSKVVYPEGAQEVAYDATGRILTRTYADGTLINFEYDKLGRVQKASGLDLGWDAQSRATLSNGIVTERDAEGRIAAITYGPEKTVRYQYNNRGSVSRIEDWLGGVTEFTYDAANQLTSMKRPNGVETTYTYDADSRTTAINDGVIASIALVRGPTGRILTADRNLPASPAVTESAQTFAYDAAHQLADAGYDKMGRLVTGSGRTYGWDLASRLRQVTAGGATTNLTYDAYGMITGSSDSQATRVWVQNYALDTPTPAIERRNDADYAYWVHAPDGTPLYRVAASDGARRFYHYDEMGNTTFLTGDDGAVTDTYAFTPYGEVLNATGSTDNPFTYQGQAGVMQIAPGLFYIRARYYDAATARFLSRDPETWRFPATASPYQYASSNPLMYIDVDGRKSCAFWDVICQGKKLVNGAVKAVKAVAQVVQERVIQPAVEFVANVAPRAVEVVVATAEVVVGAVSGAAAWTNEHIVQPVIDWATTGTQQVVNVVGQGFGGVYNAVSGALGGLSDFIFADRSPQWTVNAKLMRNYVGILAQYDPRINMGSLTNSQLVLAHIIATGGGNLTPQQMAGIVAMGGGNLRDPSVMAGIVAMGGGNFSRTQISGIVAMGGGNIVAMGGGNIVAMGGGNFAYAEQIVNGMRQGYVISGNGGTLISGNGGTMTVTSTGVISGNGGTFR